MARKNKCVECRYCEMVIDPTKGSHHRCARDKRRLSANVTSQPACENFELPKPAAHWGP